MLRLKNSTMSTPLNIAILTISDTRTAENDTSGDMLANCAAADNHTVAARALVKDDILVRGARASQVETVRQKH